MNQTLKESATNYVAPTTKNISELEKIQIDIELLDGEGTDKDGKPFKYKYIVQNNEEYRVPLTVIGQIQAILKKMPNTKFITVTRQGTTKTDTRYQVMPFINEQPVQEEQVGQ